MIDSTTPPQKQAPALNPLEVIEGSDASSAHVDRYVHPVKKRRSPRVGASTVKAARKALSRLRGGRKLDRRTWEAQALASWESQYVTALGGIEAVSPQQADVIAMICEDKLLLTKVNAFIAELQSPVHRGKRALFPIITQRSQLEASLLAKLQAIGLERRQATVKPLSERLKERQP